MAAAESIKQMLQKKLDLLCKMRDLTEAQVGILEVQDAEVLLGNLDERQALIDEIDKLDVGMLELCPQEDAQQKKAYIKKMFPEMWEDIFSILKSVTEQDAKNEAQATQIMADYRARITTTSETRKNVGSYVLPGDTGGQYFDSKK